MIPQETIEQVRQATDIVRVVSEYVRLKKRGRNFEARCPFHTEKTPSFKVSVDKQIYHCFGCGKGGNVFSFLMEHEKMSFVEAVKHLALKANVIIRDDAPDFKREHLERMNYAHEVALDYFRKLLHLSKYRQVLGDYLKGKRALSDESIEYFQLGLAGESWDGLISHATKQGLKVEELVKAGLAIRSEKKGSHFDRFRQRLMIPIFNISHKPVAFGGRTLKKGEPAKYVNSPETPLYSKSNVLYGLNFARESIREQKAVFVVEGYFDLISLWQVGLKNVVASSGTAFTEQQARLLARFAEEVYLFFDADSAGQQAALRSIAALYDAGLEVKVMVPPSGEDPDSMARKFGRERVEEVRDQAPGFIPFRVRALDINRTDVMAKEKLVRELGSLAAKISDPMRRNVFVQEAASALMVDTVRIQMARSSEPIVPRNVSPRHSKRHRLEFELLSLLFNNPGSIDSVMERISPEDFDSKQFSRLYAAMKTQYEMDGVLDANRLVEHFQDEESISQLTELAAVEWEPEIVEHETKDRTRDIVMRTQKKIRIQLQGDLARAEAEGDNEKAAQILEQLKQFGL